MPVSRRANGSWLISFYREDGARFRKTLPGELERRQCETLEAKYRLKEGARSSGARERHDPTVADLTARYWQEHGRHLASANTERCYLDLWCEALGDRRPLSEVTMDLLSRLVAFWRLTSVRGRPITPSAVNHRIDALRRSWRRARRSYGWPLPDLDWPALKLHEPEPGDRSRSDDEIARYLAELPPRSLHLSLFALHSGLRRGALLRLTRAAIDFDRGIVRAISKGRAGGKPTPVPLTDALLDVLKAMEPLPEVGCIFQVTQQQLRKDRERARLKAGLPDMRTHDLRHTFAQRLEDAGAGDLITDALHHSDPKLRRRYAKVRMDRLRDQLNRIKR